jgi:subtilase family serine protease
MKKSLAVIFMLAAGYGALGQGNARKSAAGEPPLDVRNGRARLVGHFSNPTQVRRLDFTLVTPHPDEEEQFLQELMTPGSRQFRKFLTADQWIARFATAAADEQAVVDWATSQGMTVTHRFPNRLIVDVEAPMATIETALQVKINNYVVNGYTYFANEREPVLPARLASVVRAVEGLHDFPLMRPSSFHGRVAPGPIYTPGPVVGPPRNQHADGNRAEYEKVRAASHAHVVPVPNITSGAVNQFQPSGAITMNTVKAFLRLIMVKMSVTTRSGLVARVFAGSL